MSLRQIQDLANLAVVDLESGEDIGTISSWVVFPEAQKIAAFLLPKPGIWQQSKIIPPSEVVEYGPKMVVVRSRDSIIPPSDVVGVPELIHDKMCVIGFRAESKAGKRLGQVEDFVFDITTSEITSYYIKSVTVGPGLLGQDLILPAKLVVKVEPHKIVFADSNLVGQAAVGKLAKVIE